MSSLQNKRAIITGGAHGIGRAIVDEFCRAGANVTAIDYDIKGLKSLQSAHKDHALSIVPLDITDRVGIDRLSQTPETFDIDILVNNAGVDLIYDLAVPDRKKWESVMEVNLTGTRQITEVIIADMLRHGRGGSLIFITSVHTALAFPGGAAYDASKHALVGLMRVLALEYGPKGIRANALAPGLIYPTNITTAELSCTEAERLGQRVPLGRCGHPKEIATVCAFLASDAASYING